VQNTQRLRQHDLPRTRRRFFDRAIKITGVGSGNKFRNNIFYTTGGVRMLDSNSAYSTSNVPVPGQRLVRERRRVFDQMGRDGHTRIFRAGAAAAGKERLDSTGHFERSQVRLRRRLAGTLGEAAVSIRDRLPASCRRPPPSTPA
jgi:hypothetical protein